MSLPCADLSTPYLSRSEPRLLSHVSPLPTDIPDPIGSGGGDDIFSCLCSTA